MATPSFALELDIVRLAGRVRHALGLFRRVTGLSAVTSVVTRVAVGDEPVALSPPLHPRCAKRLQSVRNAPCRREWFLHMRAGGPTRSVQSHTCPIGLRCSWIPIQVDGHLAGVAKLVVGRETSDRRFVTAESLLQLVVAGMCQEAVVSALSNEVAVLRRNAAQRPWVRAQQEVVIPLAEAADQQNVTLVENALSYLHGHYQAHALSLSHVGEALGCNPRYLTTRFTSIVGEHMHAYLVRLRVSHACRMLMESKMPIKEVSFASGFRGSTDLARAFRRHIGVSPGTYRRIFGPARRTPATA